MNDTSVAPVETVQLCALIEDCTSALALLGDITRDILEQREQLAQATGDETALIIQEQRELEARYEELIVQRSQLKSLANKTKFISVQKELDRISYRLRESTQLLCRNLKENPNVAANLSKIQATRLSLTSLLRETVDELRQGHAFRSLYSTVREDKDKEEYLQRTMEREKEATAQVKRLSDKLATVEAEKTRKVHELNVLIARKKTALQKAKKDATENYNFSKKKYSALKYSRRRQWEERERELRERLETLEKKIEIEQRCHDQISDFLGRQEEKLQSQIVAWNDRYFQDIEAKRREVEMVKIRQSQTVSQIDKMTEEFESMQQVVQRDHEEVKQREAALLFGVQMGEAAARLQRLWRGHRVRKRILQARKKKKKRRRRRK